MTKYGKTGKKIIFYDTDKRHADLKIRLHYDGLTQSAFFRAVVTGYINQDENILKFIDFYKEQSSTQSKSKRDKIKSTNKAKQKTADKFALGEKEIESIFDMLEAECPEI